VLLLVKKKKAAGSVRLKESMFQNRKREMVQNGGDSKPKERKGFGFCPAGAWTQIYQVGDLQSFGREKGEKEEKGRIERGERKTAEGLIPGVYLCRK